MANVCDAPLLNISPFGVRIAFAPLTAVLVTTNPTLANTTFTPRSHASTKNVAVNRRPPYVRLYTSSCAKAKYENAAKTPMTPNAHSNARLRSAPRESFIAVAIFLRAVVVTVSRVERTDARRSWMFKKTRWNEPEVGRRTHWQKKRRRRFTNQKPTEWVN
jgi:hypothetical protein